MIIVKCQLHAIEMLKGCLLLLLWCLFFAEVVPARAQDNGGFINIDCGLAENTSYIDPSTGLTYVSDSSFIDRGLSKSISLAYRTSSIDQYNLNVRSFRGGGRNCYTLRPALGKHHKYLIRAWFMYGNYDGLNQLPKFDLYLGVDLWDTVQISNASIPQREEIVHIPSSDYIHICLVQTGLTLPFISAIELRPMGDPMYANQSGSLQLFARVNFAPASLGWVRYKDDVYDRIWIPMQLGDTTTVSTASHVDANAHNTFWPPAIVMRTAMTPIGKNRSLYFYWTPDNVTDEFLLYMHFAEIQALNRKQRRQFNIYLNGDLWYGPMVPDYLSTTTVYSISPETARAKHEVWINSTTNSTLPPLINAIEIYTVKGFSHDSQTYDDDVTAIFGIKSAYAITKNWVGDPCSPQTFAWSGINCYYNNFSFPRIISLNLSSSGINGTITPYIANLTMLITLDLSNNKLSGPVPDFLSQLPTLSVLNLKGNNFTGPIPPELLQKSKDKTLALSIDGLDSSVPCPQCTVNCKPNRKKNIVIPVLASVAAVIAIVAFGAIFICILQRKKLQKGAVNNEL